jgi:DNA-binding HxlR family transcriptional regulator
MNIRSYHQYCGLAYALDFIGERWTLLIIRELFAGPRRFTDLMQGLPGISTNLLTERLKYLDQQGLLIRRVLPPPAGSTVYELTERGRGLEKTLIELGKWGSQFVPPSIGDDVLLNASSYALTLKTLFRPEQAQDINETYELRIDDEVLQVRIKAGGLHVQQGEAIDADVVLATNISTYLGLLTGKLTVEDAISKEQVRVEGNRDAIRRFFEICGVPATR